MDMLDGVGHTPTAMALIAMAAKDSGAAMAIARAVAVKDNSLHWKPFPRYRLLLEADSAPFAELQELQTKQQKLVDECGNKFDAIQRDYMEKMNSLSQRTYELVAGLNGTGKGIPGFWLHAMLSDKFLSEGITREDEEALMYLMNIKCCSSVAPERSLKLEFIFDSRNPFFTNTVLTKVLHYRSTLGQSSVDKALGTPIDWKEGKCLTRYDPQRTALCLSFFNFFDTVTNDDGHPVKEYGRSMTRHHGRIGGMIVERIIPHAVNLYISGAREEEPDNGGWVLRRHRSPTQIHSSSTEFFH